MKKMEQRIHNVEEKNRILKKAMQYSKNEKQSSSSLRTQLRLPRLEDIYSVGRGGV